MDEVNHVKMVVSLLYYYYAVHACFLFLHDDAVIMLYKYFWIKRFLIFFLYFADFLNGFSFSVSEVYYIWYQSEVETLGPIGLKTLQHVSF